MISLGSGLLAALIHASATVVACESVLRLRGSAVGNGKSKCLHVHMESGVQINSRNMENTEGTKNLS